MSRINALFLVAVLLAVAPSITEGVNAYIYYNNAACIDNSTISGTFNLAYDDSSLSKFGLSLGYEGSCLYFKDGYLNLNNFTSAWDAMEFGYCVTCNGVVTCAGDDSCDDVATISSSNIYQMTEQSANAYQKKEVSLQAFKNAQEIDYVAMEIIGVESDGLSGAWYSVIGAFIGLFSMFGLLAALEGHRQYRMKRRNPELSQAFAEVV